MHIQLRWTWLSNRSSNYLLRSASGWSTGGTLDLEGSRRWPPLLKHLWEWFRCSQLGPPHLQLRSLGCKWCRWYHIIPYSMRMDAHRFNSVLFRHSVMSDSLWPHWSIPRFPCPSPTAGACSNSCPLSPWCHRTISSSFVPFSSCLQFSQHQGIFQWIISSHQVAKVLQFQLLQLLQPFQWIFMTDFL